MSAAKRELSCPGSDAGERPTFRALFEAEYLYVRRSLQRFGVRTTDIDDAAHDVFAAVHRHYEAYDPSRPIRPWLFAFVIRIAAKHKERARRRRDRDDALTSDLMIDESPCAEAQLAAAQVRRFVLGALQHVAPERRSVLVLHELDEQPIPEIASALGIPLNTAYSRLRLARADFRAVVARLRASALDDLR
ncbi:MAG: RNA polymerase sigma factor [Polyangiaceae bacterium]